MAVEIEVEGHTTSTSTEETEFLQNRSVSRRTPPSEG